MGVGQRGTLAICALMVTTGLTLHVLSCALYKNWLNMFVIGFYVVLPLPQLIFATSKDSFDVFNPVPSGRDATAAFLTAGLICCPIAFPAVLTHTEEIQTAALFITLGGTALIYGSVGFYGYMNAAPKDDMAFL